MERAKNAINNDQLFLKLILISENYEPSNNFIDTFGNILLNIKSVYKSIMKSELNSDSYKIKKYINQKLLKNDIKFINRLQKNKEPNKYAGLFESKSATMVIERSFSQLNSMLLAEKDFANAIFRAFQWFI
ncbi:hypothetical protein CDIK_3955 [Cucumispora dikerogammari]|nr:hypothetical protein CDIK_3955 [Cucumispora dikerogammari]